MIDAEFRSEERFSRLALAYDGDQEKKTVTDCVESMIKKHDIQPEEMYTTKVSSGREVLVIEYHDDNSRESGDVFEEIIKALNIKVCS